MELMDLKLKLKVEDMMTMITIIKVTTQLLRREN